MMKYCTGCESRWTQTYHYSSHKFYLLDEPVPHGRPWNYIWSDNPIPPHRSYTDEKTGIDYIGRLYICDMCHEELIFRSLSYLKEVV